MYRVTVGASFRLRCGVSGLLSVLLLTILASTPAEARWKKRGYFKRAAVAASYAPRYADIVVDANSGDVLHDANADSIRHPASLTKIMTLYLLFERLEAGRLTLQSKLEASENATEQAPTKLGLKLGQSIAVEDAIKALVTKSANDVAVVIAEALAGSEEEFAKAMTRKARALGMSRTVYKNASGLPDDDQVTTARDQALLAMAIQDRHPRYYRYFATSSFAWRGVSIRNHNRLLGRVEGVDGIKTGYTRASGFNLVTSVKRGKRHVVAVVLGGRSGGARDARMRELIEAHVNEGATNRTAPRVAEAGEAPDRPAKARVASAPAPTKEPAPQKQEAPKQDNVTTAAIPPARPAPAPGSTDPIKPNAIKTLTVKASASQVAAIAPVSLLSPMPVTSQTHATLGGRNEPELPPPPPGAKPGVLGVLSTQAVAAPATAPAPAPKPAAVYASASTPAPAISAAPPAPAVQAPAALHIPSESKPRSGWIVQVGAYEDIAEAREKLTAAKAKAANLLRGSDPFTEPVVRGEKTLYRARFAGLKQDQAEAVCRELKRTDIVCMAVRN